jgi:hypothetical protein
MYKELKKPIQALAAEAEAKNAIKLYCVCNSKKYDKKQRLFIADSAKTGDCANKAF